MAEFDSEKLFRLAKYDKLVESSFYKKLLWFAINLLDDSRYNCNIVSLQLYFSIIPLYFRSKLDNILMNYKLFLPDETEITPPFAKLEYIELQLQNSKAKKNDFLKSIKNLLSKIYKKLPEKQDIKKLFIELFELTDYEWNTLLFVYWYAVFKPFNHVILDMQSPWDSIESLVSIMTNFDLHELTVSQPFCMLSEKGIIKGGSLPIPNDIFNPDILNLLKGRDVQSLYSKYAHEYAGAIFPLNSYPVTTKDNNLVHILISNCGNNHILLHGKPGTGKSSYAAAVIFESGRIPVFLTINEDQNNSDIYTALRMITKIIDYKKNILVVDEADSLLNKRSSFFDTSKSEKGVRNRLLDNVSIPVIWITNLSENIPPSTRRRFKYSICFKNTTPTQRLSTWQEQLKQFPLIMNVLPSKMISNWAEIYDVPASVVNSALSSANMMVLKSTDSASEIIKQVIENQAGFLPDIATIGKYTNKKYSLDMINSTYEIKDLLNSVRNYYECPPVKTEQKNPLTILLYGPPGTGKTALAEYLSRCLNRNLIKKQSADLKSPFVGKTEENIHESFIEAEKSQSILLIDEADSFIVNRKHTNSSWEISSVNQFLNSMENFNGVLICTTNRANYLDKASIRRFILKIEFKPLKPVQIVNILKRYFPDIDVSIEDCKKLSGLTPGDVSTVFKRCSYYNNNRNTKDIIIKEIESELSCKRDNNIGF